MKITEYILKVLDLLIKKHKYSYEIAIESLISGIDYIEIYYNLGVCYEKGKGVEQDYAEAVRLYKLSAEQGLRWCSLR